MPRLRACCCAYESGQDRGAQGGGRKGGGAACGDRGRHEGSVFEGGGEKAERGAATMAAMKLIGLKSEGAAVVAERAAMQAALKTKTLKLEGAKVAAARAEMMAALKAKTLAMEGAKVVAHRAAMADALKIKTLKLDGAKVVAHKAEMMEAYKSAEMELAEGEDGIDGAGAEWLRVGGSLLILCVGIIVLCVVSSCRCTVSGGWMANRCALSETRSRFCRSPRRREASSFHAYADFAARRAAVGLALHHDAPQPPLRCCNRSTRCSCRDRSIRRCCLVAAQQAVPQISWILGAQSAIDVIAGVRDSSRIKFASSVPTLQFDVTTDDPGFTSMLSSR